MIQKNTKATALKNMEEAGVHDALRVMEKDDTLKTEASYSGNVNLYPDHQIPFVDKHITYLLAHPKVNPKHYLSNLRLMLRVKS